MSFNGHLPCQVLSSENRYYLSHWIDEVTERLRQFSISQGYITSSMPASLTPCPAFFIHTDSRGRGWEKNLRRVPLVTSIIRSKAMWSLQLLLPLGYFYHLDQISSMNQVLSKVQNYVCPFTMIKGVKTREFLVTNYIC